MGLASEGQALRGGHGTAQEECKVLIEKPRLHSGGKMLKMKIMAHTRVPECIKRHSA